VLLALANVGLKRFHQEGAMQRHVLALLIIAAPFSAFAAELPKEGSYDFTSCASGIASVIDFSKTHTGSSFEETGTIRSNPPGGLFDKNAYRCVGMNTSFDGKNTAYSLCQSIDPDGDKRLSFYSTGNDGKTTRTQVAGTGKYEGIVVNLNSVENLGPFPHIKDGTYQNCFHQAGTYKLK
jgi:hypothetical protein